MISAAIQSLIDKGLFDRLPVTFSTFFFDQVKDWELLFPAEQSYHERLFSLIDRSDSAAIGSLFAPLRAAETKMGVNEKNWPRRSFTLDQVDFLNRSPFYAEWRKAVSAVFAKLDPILDAETARSGRPRLAIVISPSELPADPDRMWLRIRDRGRRIKLDGDIDLEKHLTPLLNTPAKPYDRWTIDAASSTPSAPGTVRLSYDDLEKYRARLATEVQKLLETTQIRGPREMGARLKQLKLREGSLASDPVLAEFTRSVLLSGNGTLLINNTFVEWATIQAIRRARPSLVVTSFGVRNKMKPFSSLLIYADQETASPIPTQMDTLGTYVDLEVFYQYLWQEFEKYPEYRRNTAYVFLALGMEELLVIAPADFTVPSSTTPQKLFTAAREWLGA